MEEDPNEVNIIYHTIEAPEEMENQVEGVSNLVDFVATTDGNAEGEQVQLAYLEVQEVMDVDQSAGFTQEININSSHFLVTQDGTEKKLILVVNDKNGAAQLLNSDGTILEGDGQEQSYGNGITTVEEGGPSTSSAAEGCLEVVQESEYNHTMYIDGDHLLQLKGNAEGFNPETALWAKLQEKDDGSEMLFIPSNPELASSILLTSNGDKSDRNRNLMHLACIAGELQSVQIHEGNTLEEETVVETENEVLEDQPGMVAVEEDVDNEDLQEVPSQEITEQAENEFESNVPYSIVEADQSELGENAFEEMTEAAVPDGDQFVEQENIDDSQETLNDISEEVAENPNSDDLFQDSIAEASTISAQCDEEINTVQPKEVEERKRYSRRSKRHGGISKTKSVQNQLEDKSSENETQSSDNIASDDTAIASEPSTEIKIPKKNYRHTRKQATPELSVSDSKNTKSVDVEEEKLDLPECISEIKRKFAVLKGDLSPGRQRTTSSTSVDLNKEDTPAETSTQTSRRSSSRGSRIEKETAVIQKDNDSWGLKEGRKDFSTLASELDKDIELISTSASSEDKCFQNGKLSSSNEHANEFPKEDSAEGENQSNDLFSQNSDSLIMQPPKKTYTRTQNLIIRSDESRENNSNTSSVNVGEDNRDSFDLAEKDNADALDNKDSSQSEDLQPETMKSRKRKHEGQNSIGTFTKKQKILTQSKGFRPVFQSSIFHSNTKKKSANLAKSYLASKKKSMASITYGTLSKNLNVTTDKSPVRKRLKSSEGQDPFAFQEEEATDYSSYGNYCGNSKKKRRGRPIGSTNRIVNDNATWDRILKSDPKKIKKQGSYLAKLQKSNRKKSLSVDNDISQIQASLDGSVILTNKCQVLPETPNRPRITLKNTDFRIREGTQLDLSDDSSEYSCPYCEFTSNRIGNIIFHLKNCDIKDPRYNTEVTNMTMRQGMREGNEETNTFSAPKTKPIILYNPEASLFDICHMNTYSQLIKEKKIEPKKYAEYHARVISSYGVPKPKTTEESGADEANKENKTCTLTKLSNDIVTHIIEGHCNQYLFQIYENKIKNKRHDKFATHDVEEKLTEKTSHEPISNSMVNHKKIHTYLQDLLRQKCKCDKDLDALPHYVNNVWCPEAVIMSISNIQKKTLEEAESYYNSFSVLLAFDH